MVHLRYDLQMADITCNEGGHPQTVLKGLRIRYQHRLISSMGAFWIFWNCENIPNELPEYLKEETSDPKSWVGYGINEVVANEIANYGSR